MSAWAEDALRNGYPLGLLFAHVQPTDSSSPEESRRKAKTILESFLYADSNPECELTKTGRLFYKLLFMKGPSQQQIRIAARRRVYDMRYLTKHRLYGPFLPVTQPLGYGVPTEKEKIPRRSPSPPSSGSASRRGDNQIHLDVLTLLSACIHPHFLLHRHLIHPTTDPFSGDSLDEGVPDGPNRHPPPKQLNPGCFTA
jgi:hypothetical protein